MEEITGKTVLITGASSGIGRQLSFLFASHRNDLVVVARREDRLLALKRELESSFAITVTIIVEDLASATAVANILAVLDAKNIAVDVLVNNAGYSLPGLAFHARDLSQYFDLMRVGIQSSMQLIHSLLPGMAQRRYGRVLTIGSIAGGFNAVKDHAVYCATKAFLIHLSLSLNEENRHSNVCFTVICPGFVESEFHVRAGLEETVKKLPSWMIMPAKQAALESYRSLAAKKPYAVLGAPNQFSMALIKLLPMSWGIRLFTPQ